MDASERRMLVFAMLAGESRIRSQAQGEFRFLLLTGAAACQAAYLKVAHDCQKRALELNPNHLLAQYDSIEHALRSDDFKTFLKRLDRFCTFEQAEMLVERQYPNWENQEIDDLEEHCLQLLQGENH